MASEESNSAQTFMGALAEKLGGAVRAANVFGEPVERDGITVIPVARARWGFGGGVGRRRDEDGAGGGGGAQVSPIGFIELKDGEAEFRRIRTVSLPWIIAGGLATLFLLPRILRQRKR